MFSYGNVFVFEVHPPHASACTCTHAHARARAAALEGPGHYRGSVSLECGILP